MHEQSETVQLPNGRWINVYGRNTPQAGQRLPQDASGFGHGEYATMEEAVAEAQRRSNAYPNPNESSRRLTVPDLLDALFGEEPAPLQPQRRK